MALELRGHLGGLHHHLRLVAAHVQHGGSHGPGQVGAVQGGAAALAGRGEAHLVVDDQVQRAAHLEVRQPAERQGLLVDTLPGERRVTVDLLTTVNKQETLAYTAPFLKALELFVAF